MDEYITSVKVTAVKLALEYSEKIAGAEFQSPSEFVGVAEMIYHFLSTEKIHGAE